jgi:hypothetical protein
LARWWILFRNFQRCHNSWRLSCLGADRIVKAREEDDEIYRLLEVWSCQYKKPWILLFPVHHLRNSPPQ